MNEIKNFPFHDNPTIAANNDNLQEVKEKVITYLRTTERVELASPFFCANKCKIGFVADTLKDIPDSAS